MQERALKRESPTRFGMTRAGVAGWPAHRRFAGAGRRGRSDGSSVLLASSPVSGYGDETPAGPCWIAASLGFAESPQPATPAAASTSARPRARPTSPRPSALRSVGPGAASAAADPARSTPCFSGRRGSHTIIRALRCAAGHPETVSVRPGPPARFVETGTRGPTTEGDGAIIAPIDGETPPARSGSSQVQAVGKRREDCSLSSLSDRMIRSEPWPIGRGEQSLPTGRGPDVLAPGVVRPTSRSDRVAGWPDQSAREVWIMPARNPSLHGNNVDGRAKGGCELFLIPTRDAVSSSSSAYHRPQQAA